MRYKTPLKKILGLALLVYALLPHNSGFAQSVQNLEGYVSFIGTVILRWDETPEINYFRVQRRIQGTEEWENLPVQFNSDIYGDSYVAPGTVYEYRVINAETEGPTEDFPASDIIEISIPEINADIFFQDAQTLLTTSIFNYYSPTVHELSYGNGKWMAFDPWNRLIESTDGSNWQTVSENWTSPGRILAFFNGHWITNYPQNEGDTPQLIYSDQPDVGWENAISEITAPYIYDFKVLPSCIVALCLNPAQLLKSEDGIHWETIDNLPYAANRFGDLAYDPASGRYYLLWEGDVLSTDELGHPWRELPGNSFVSTLIPTQEGLVLLQQVDSDAYQFSKLNGEHSPTFSSKHDTAWSDSEILLFDYSGNRFKTSQDGIDWSDWQSSNLDPYTLLPGSIAYGNGQWMAASKDGSIYASTDGVSWTEVHQAFNPHTYIGSVGNFLAINDAGILITSTYRQERDYYSLMSESTNDFDYYNFLKDPDAPTYIPDFGCLRIDTHTGDWAWATIPESIKMKDAIWDGQKFIVVGDSESILTSTDGLEWTELHSTESNAAFESLAYKDGTYVVSNGSNVLYSTDLISWQVEQNDLLYPFGQRNRKVMLAGDFFFAVDLDKTDAYNHVSTRSSDGIEWSALGINQCHGVAAGSIDGELTYLAISEDGTYRSTDATTWTLLNSERKFDSICHNGSVFLAINGSGDSESPKGKVYASIDGSAWTRVDSIGFTENSIQKLILDGNATICVDGRGNIQSFIADSSASGTGSGEIAFTQDQLHVIESTFDTEHAIILRRSKGMEGAVSVRIQSLDSGTAVSGEDFTAIDTTVTWKDGEYGDKRIPFVVLPDSLVEGSETTTLSLSISSGEAGLGDMANLEVVLHDSPLNSWLYKYFAGDDSAAARPEGDWDEDEMPNYMEFCIGRNPTYDEAIPYLPSGLLLFDNNEGPGSVFLRFYLRHDETIIPWIQQSADLITWSPKELVAPGTMTPSPSDIQELKSCSATLIRSDEEANSLFMRLSFSYGSEK